MKKYKSLLLSFFIPIIVILIGLLFNKIYPFGEKILLMLDGYTQYPGFLNTFKGFLVNHQSILYSLKGITGFNLYASSIYYTFNITNLFYLLFKTDNIISFYTFVIILKVGLASLCMNIFLKYINKNKDSYTFSICYGLTAYNLLYYLNYMWFDSIILLPLVILGIEKIFKENKYYFYLLFLTLSIILNFYIGYMICIFSLVYFIYKCIINKSFKKFIVKFILFSIIAALISSFVLIPVVLELLQGKNELFAGTNYFKFDLDFINIFYKLTLGSLLNGDLEYGTPNVYIGIFAYVNAILYFFNSNIKLKERLTSLGVCLFFLLSMSFNLLDYFWQMLQMPIWYPVRYAFIFDFFLIMLAYKNYLNYEKYSLKKYLIIIGSLLLLIIIGFITSGNLKDPINIPAKLIYLGISIFFLIYYLFIMDNKYLKKFIWFIIIFELSINTFVIFRNNGNENTLTEYKTNYSFNTTALNKIDTSFVRTSIDQKVIKNNGLLLKYNSLNYFSSLRNKKTFNMFKNLGILVIDDCNASYYFNNPIINALMGIKYYITDSKVDYYELIEDNIYENKDATSLGFEVNSKIKDLKISNSYVVNINNIYKIITGSNNSILSEIPVTDKNVTCSTFHCITNGANSYIKYEYTANKEVFIFMQNDYPISKDDTDYTITLNKEVLPFDTKTPILLKKGDKISVLVEPKQYFKDFDYHLFVVDMKLYQEFVKKINESKMEIIDYYSDAHFKGKITMNNDNTIFTTISNDKGWTIYVDGKKSEITPILDGLIGIVLTKGTHEIEFKYFPPGLKEGIIISSISLCSIIIIYIVSKRRQS